ncbi:MAG: HDOD domain-containing protein, partial [Planctomycetota bacterium]
GFEAVRSAVLSVQVVELFDDLPSAGGEVREHPVFDRRIFWEHSLAVGVACELLAETRGLRGRVHRSEAYISGLLHDLGQLVLHVILPASFDRVCDLAEARGLSLDHACRRVIGIDSHTAGKRLAEHWHLPHALADVLWLHGQPFDSVPDLPHRETIGLVTLADALVRRQHITTVGRLHDEVSERARLLGLDTETTTGLLLRSVSRANDVLGRMNDDLRSRVAGYETQVRSLQAITDFHAAAMPSGSVVTVLGKVVKSASSVLGEGFYGMLYQAKVGQSWQLLQFASDGRVLRSDLIDPPMAAGAVEELGDDLQVSMQALAILPWLTDYMGDADNLHNVRLLPLRCGWGVSAVLMHDRPLDDGASRLQLDALSRTWAAAIAAASQHQGAKRLGEELAEANRALTDAQEELTRSQAMAAVGEVAAGAAHEMNNPLAIISGRAQILAERCSDRTLKSMAAQIFEQSHRLSDMITAMRSVAEPAVPDVRPIELTALLERIVQDFSPKRTGEASIELVVEEGLPRTVHLDPDQITRAVHELLRNAIEAGPAKQIELGVQIDGSNDRLKIQVADKGPGLSKHALAHAFDPFFSDKPAGRQRGMGLAVARQIVEAHHGRLTLENAPAGGAIGTILLPLEPASAQRSVA